MSNYVHIDFKPPKAVQDACRTGAGMVDAGHGGDGLEAGTIAWAHRIATGGTVSPDKARKAHRFWLRNRRFLDLPHDSPGYVSALLWGGQAGRAWFARLWSQMLEADHPGQFSADSSAPDGWTWRPHWMSANLHHGLILLWLLLYGAVTSAESSEITEAIDGIEKNAQEAYQEGFTAAAPVGSASSPEDATKPFVDTQADALRLFANAAHISRENADANSAAEQGSDQTSQSQPSPLSDDTVRRRVTLYCNAILSQYWAGLVAGAVESGQSIIWRIGATKESCRDCLEMASLGPMPAEDFAATGLYPQSFDLACHGFRCQCFLEVAPDDSEKASFTDLGSLHIDKPTGEEKPHRYSFACTNCRHEFETEDNVRGRYNVCPKCGAMAARLGASDFRHTFASTQIDLPPALADLVTGFAASIPDADMGEDGREDTPHCTVCYGLHTFDPHAVAAAVKDHGPVTLRFGPTSVFEGKDGRDDVVKFDVHSPDLHALHQKIRSGCDTTVTFPDYRPHVTVAYVKAGQGAKFAGNDSLIGTEHSVDEITFSDARGRRFVIPLKGDAMPQPAHVHFKVGDISLPIAPRDHPWDAGAAAKRVRDHTGSDKEPTGNFGKAFLACAGDPKLFTSYKLPIADIVGGKLTIIPHGAFNAAARLKQTDLPAASRKSAEEDLEKIYKRMADQFHDPEIVAPWLPDDDGDDDSAVMPKGYTGKRKAKMAAFSLTANQGSRFEDGDYVYYPNSFLFEVGDYPDKKFSLNTAEMNQAVQDFAPVPIDLEHVPTMLDGKLGDVIDARTDGKKLFGTVKIPKWLDSQLPEDKPVSCEWDRTSKKLTGLALVEHPRITGAALMAAFNAAEAAGFKSGQSGGPPTTQGKVLMGDTSGYYSNPHQVVHDFACSQGAHCPGKSMFGTPREVEGRADFITPELLREIQKHHDNAAKMGADCDAYMSKLAIGHPLAHQASMTSLPAMMSADRSGKEKKMNVWQTIAAKFKKLPDDATEEQVVAVFAEATKEADAGATTTGGGLSEADKAEFSSLKVELAKLREENVALKTDFSAEQTKQAEQAKAAHFAQNSAWIKSMADEFRITSHEAESLTKKLGEVEPAFFDAHIRPLYQDREPIAALVGFQSTRVPRGTQNGADDAEIITFARDRAKKDNITFGKALEIVSREHPDKAAAYRASAPVAGGK
ncbi:MAG TPA: 2'-5' RNA ligase family protein [Bryobacteraceae bacterium]|nr:2'-5' RNA ligase family protein [Bryobacteraceae bacterium]